ncbi:MAG: HugZ family protein [Burkholderiaceae bacterium]
MAGDPPENANRLRDVDEQALTLTRQLIRGAAQGSLATLEAGLGWPAASLVTVATMLDGCPVILISSLSGHTSALRADPRCGLLLSVQGQGDPLAHPRISLQARAYFLDREGPDGKQARRRFLNRHHKAALYADFGDFSFVRLEPDHASLNGGFGKAYALSADQLRLYGDAVADFDIFEQSAVDHMNSDHREAINAYAQALAGQPPGEWLMTGIDPEGFDLIKNGQACRIDFDERLEHPDQVRPALAALARQARQKLAKPAPPADN